MNKSLAVFYLSFFIQLSATAQIPKITGAMRNVMWKGELAGLIQIDTISNKKGLYGLGPLEYLQGEILILDGITYVSKVKEIKSMEVFVTENVKAPFFGYDNIHEWKEISLSKQVKDLKSLEKFIDQYNRSNDLPFFFKLEGKIKDANIHIVNLPAGSVVKSPDDAHQGQVNYQLKDKLVTLIGFFSHKHKAVFTHHDTFMHIHLITQDKDMMGHLEEITFLAKDFKLFIPANIGQ